MPSVEGEGQRSEIAVLRRIDDPDVDLFKLEVLGGRRAVEAVDQMKLSVDFHRGEGAP